METLLKPLKKDLTELFNNDVIECAKDLKTNVCFSDISDNQIPMYFTGKYDAKTVFVMLNPGGASQNCYSFAKCDKFKYNDLNQFFDIHIKEHIEYGKIDCGRMDNFDLKQAAFLYAFEDSGLDIVDFFQESKDEKKLKLSAKENVLMNKLQLELIPYRSSAFRGMLDTPKKASENINKIMPHIERVLDAILQFDRKYVIFGAKQFYNLFNAIPENANIKIELGTEKTFEITDLKNNVNVNTVSITYKNKKINALIPYSFPRQDLPNADSKMKQYGKFCYDELNIRFSK